MGHSELQMNKVHWGIKSLLQGKSRHLGNRSLSCKVDRSEEVLFDNLFLYGQGPTWKFFQVVKRRDKHFS